MSFTIDPTGRYITVTSHGYYHGANAIPRIKKPVTGLEYINNIKTSKIENPTGHTLAHILASLSKQTGALSSAISALSFPTASNPAFAKTASISDAAKASATASSGASAATYRLGIDRLATAKTMSSGVVAGDAATGLAAGTHSFDLTVDDTTETLTISVDTSGTSPDTNRDVLIKMARAIESAGDSLDATVVESTRKVYSTLSDSMQENTAQLRVTAQDTGESVDFSLSDTGSGTVIEDLKLNRLVSPGIQARYSINSMAGDSDTNSITAGGGQLNIELLAATGSSPVTIKVEEGLAPLQSAIGGIIASYNDYMSWLDENSRFIDPVLKDTLKRDVSSIARDLAGIGLKVTDRGTIDITDRFATALSTRTGTVASVLTGTNGLFTRIASSLSAVKTNGAQTYARSLDHDARAMGFSVFA